MISLLSALREFLSGPPVAPGMWPRRVFHLLFASGIPISLLYLPIDLAQWLLIAGSIGSVITEVVRSLSNGINDFFVHNLPFFKSGERFEVTGATNLWVSATVVVFVFDKDVAVLSLLFLAVGDPLAATFGVRDHRIRIFGKSLVGTAVFVLGAALAGTVAAAHPDISRVWWMVPGAIVAAVTELLPLHIDDNLSIPIAAASAMTLLKMI